MASDGRIKVVAELDSRLFDAGLDRMKSNAERAADTISLTITRKASKAAKQGSDDVAAEGEKGVSRIEKKFDGLGAAIQGVFSGVAQSVVQRAMDAIGDSVEGAIQRVDTMRNFPKVMQNFGVSSQDASKMVRQLDKGVRGLPTSLSDITATVQSFVPLTKDTQTATKTTLALNDALVAGGQSSAIQKNALEQYRQALAKGKPTLQDWRSIQSAMPAQLQQIAKYLGVGSGKLSGYTANSQGLYEAMKDGEITMDDLNNAIVDLDTKGGDGFKNFHDQAKDASGGIQTSMTNAKLAVQRGVADIIEALRGGRDGKTFVEELGLAFEKFAKVVADVIKFIEKHPLGAKIAVGVFGAAESIGWLSKTIDTLKGDGEGISAVFAGIGKALGKTNIGSFFKLIGDGVGKLGGLAGAASSAGGALSGMLGSIGGFLSANPVVLIVGAIALVIGALVLLYNKCEPFRDFVDGIVKSVVGFVQDAAKTVGDAVGGVVDWVKGAIKGVSDFIQGAISAIKGVIKGVADFVQGVVGGVVGFIEGVIKGVSDFIQDAIGVIKDIVGGIAGAVKAVWDAIAPIRDFIYNVLIFAIAVITNIIDLLAKGIGAALVALWTGVLVPLWDFVWGSILQPLIDFLGNTLGALFEGVKGIIKGVVDTVVGFFQGMVGVIQGVIGAAVSYFQGVWGLITSTISGIVGFVQTVWDGVMEIIGGIASWIDSTIIQPASSFITGFLNGLVAGVQGVWNSITSVIGAVAGWINSVVIQPTINFYRGLFNAVTTGVSNAWNFAKGIVSGVAGWIKSNVIDKIVSFFQAGWNAVQSGVKALADGVRRVFSTIAGAIKAPINGIIGGINNVIKKMNSLTVPDWVPGLGGAHANFSMIPKLATGGYVAGAGTATSDSNLAWLSRGEYVVRADTVKRYGVEFMDALNEGAFGAGRGGRASVQNYYYQFDRNANSRWQYQQVRTGAAA